MVGYFPDQRTYAMCLVVKCPFDIELTNCPLSELRKLPLVDRVKKIEIISYEKLGEIIAYHGQCLIEREADLRYLLSSFKTGKRNYLTSSIHIIKTVGRPLNKQCQRCPPERPECGMERI